MKGRIQTKAIARQESAYRLPVIGKVKTGEKKISAGGKEYPSALEYFRFTGKYAEEVVKALGNDKPNKIGIYFADDDFKKVCDERFEARDERGLVVLEGDGESFRAYDPQTHKFIDIDKTHPLINLYRKNIKHVLTIRFLISGFRGVLGQWELTTRGSKTSIDRIINSFDAMLELAGRVKGIPFDLTIEIVKSKTMEGITRQFPVISLIPNLSPESVEALGQNIGEISNRLSLLTDEKISRQLGSGKPSESAPETGKEETQNIIPSGEHKEFNPETDLDAEDMDGEAEAVDFYDVVEEKSEPEEMPRMETYAVEDTELEQAPEPEPEPETAPEPEPKPEPKQEPKPIFDNFENTERKFEPKKEEKPKTGMKGKNASNLFEDE